MAQQTDASYAVVRIGKTFFELVDGTYTEWYVADTRTTPDTHPGYTVAILTNGRERATVDADRLGAAVQDDENPRWVPALYDGESSDGAEWIPHPRRADPDADLDDVDVQLRTAPDSPSGLTFAKIEGRGSRTEVNNFLEGAADGLVSHELGGVSSWKAAFVARGPTGGLVSVLVLHHYHPSTNGSELAITRLANHPSAPKNTSTWMIARARRWAERTGYDRLATYAGVGENEGTCYRAAGFQQVGELVEVEGKDWKGDREGETWTKRKFVYDLSPDTYSDKSDEWAIETVCDGVIVPGRNGLQDSQDTVEIDAFANSGEGGETSA